jgi:hypothetical protein
MFPELQEKLTTTEAELKVSQQMLDSVRRELKNTKTELAGRWDPKPLDPKTLTLT